MPGPCSFPEGDKRRQEEMNEIVCDVHYVCNGPVDGKPCVLLTYREWLLRRNRLQTGKTV